MKTRTAADSSGWKRSLLNTTLLFGLLGALAGCSKSLEASHQQAAESINDGLGCVNFKSLFMDSLYGFIEAEKAKPDVDLLKSQLKKVFNEKQDLKDQALLKATYALLDEVLDNAKTGALSSKELLQLLIQFEMGNQSTEFHRTQGDKIEARVNELRSLASTGGAPCAAPEAPAEPPQASEPTPVEAERPAPSVQFALPAPLFGAYFSMATAYQSCQALSLPEMSNNTEDVVGVRKGKDIGGGFRREYASIPDIVRTHYYVRQQSYRQGCFDLTKKPLVYDYGGEPKVETSRINFFSNSGEGGSALGLDCSAFISSALASAGLRYSPGVPNKPVFIRQISENFINPKASGWKCFDQVSVAPTSNLRPGDIMGVRGHVVMVERVGEDPFGLARVSSRAGCDSLSYKNYDFAVIQSSPSKGSIGINKYAARDYLPESEKMMTAFASYARAACLSKFDGKSYNPASSNFGLIRHNGTSSCKAPRVELANQSCISSCAVWN
jgi:hypothetical protein